MGLIKSRGIVLHKNLTNDIDASISVLEENGNKNKFIVKGIQKTKKRSILSVEPGSLVSMDYYPQMKNNLHNVKEINLEQRFDIIKNDYLSTLIMYLFLELTERTIPQGISEPKYFGILLAGLSELENNGAKLKILPFFKIKLLYHSGLIPKEFSCSICHNDFSSSVSGKMNYFNFELLCDSCSTIEENDIDIIKLMRYIVHTSYSQFLTLNPTRNLLLKSNSILDTYINYNLGVVLKSNDILYPNLKELYD